MLIEKLAEAFASFVFCEHVFFLHPGLRGTSHTGRKAVANRLAARPERLWRVRTEEMAHQALLDEHGQ